MTSITPTPPRHPSPLAVPTPNRYFRHGQKDRGGGERSLHLNNHGKAAGPVIDRRNSRKPRVVGHYAYQTDDLDGWKGGQSNNNDLPPYVFLTERIDPYLLSHTSQTLRRMRLHNYYRPRDTSLSDAVHNYNLAIADSNAEVKAEDPLRNLMLSSKSRDTFRSIRDDSEDYEYGISEPLEDDKCEATPENAKWMLHSFPTCNFVHEFDFANALGRGKTKLLGHGYWRDVWPVLDMEPSTLLQEKKVVLKTIRYEHDYTPRNFDRHIRDAIVTERLTASPRVTDINAFCGNSGLFEFAAGGSLVDRLERHYLAKMEKEEDDEGGQRRHNASKKDDDDILDQRAKLNIAHQVAAGLADFHEADAMRDENGEIISAAIAHADITTDQFVSVGGDNYKLNDFNRCRFMRRYRNSNSSGGDGKPCGFYIGNNPAKNRSPEEYAYTVETDKIDIYSMGNIFYSILTDLDPWEDWEDEEAQKAVMKGQRPEVPESIKSSVDLVDVALRKMMYKCWAHKPEDRPRARTVADYFSQKLSELDQRDGKKKD